MPLSPEDQLDAFVAKFSPANRRLIRGLRTRLKRAWPAANELVWDNYNFLVIGFCPTEKASDCYFSIGTDKNGANLFFGYNGTKIRDPHNLLHGSGTSNRFVRLSAASDLERPEIKALIMAAVAVSKPMGKGLGKVSIRSIAEKQRARQ